MRWLKILLVINGLAFILYGLEALYDPSPFWMPKGSPASVVDIGRAMGLTQLAIGVIQLGTWRITERVAIELVAGVSLVFAAGFGILLGMNTSTTSDDMFHQFGLPGAAAWLIVAAPFAGLMYRERRMATA